MFGFFILRSLKSLPLVVWLVAHRVVILTLIGEATLVAFNPPHPQSPPLHYQNIHHITNSNHHTSNLNQPLEKPPPHPFFKPTAGKIIPRQFFKQGENFFIQTLQSRY